jgi:hypothetical protein
MRTALHVRANASRNFPARGAARLGASEKSGAEKNYSIRPYCDAAEWLACAARGLDRE